MTDLPECLRTIERQQWEMEEIIVPVDLLETTRFRFEKPGYLMGYHVELSMEKGWVARFTIVTERTDASRD